MITHDRYFLDNVTGWILELDRGRGVPYEGNYSTYLEKKAKRMAQEGREDDSRMRALSREREWMLQGAKARQTKSKARIKAYNELVELAEQRRPADGQDRHPDGRAPRPEGDRGRRHHQELRRPGAHREPVVQAAAGRYRRRHRSERRRKSTLFKMLTGQEKPDAGEIKIGETVDLGYVDQSRDHLDPNKNVWEEVTGAVRYHEARQVRDEQPRLCRQTSTSRAPTSSRRSARFRVVSATACTSPRC